MMQYLYLLVWVISIVARAATPDTQGIYDLVARRMPQHADSFRFTLVNATSNVIASASDKPNDQYVISTADDGKVLVEGNSLSALMAGLHRYLSDVAHVGIYWFIGNRLDVAPAELPQLSEPIEESSIVPWRYHFNTVTFSYTTAFWDWDDWELQLDWMALRGINLPLAWVGFEKTLVEVFQEIGLTKAEISSFLSGPAFQAWNRFGNIQGSWGGELPYSWIDNQFEFQKKIVARMVELGMTPVLPAFTGFVPRAITRVLPNASVVNASEWAFSSPQYTNVSFLEPFDEHFALLQKSFLSKQQAAFGNITNIYTLDQYNELNPYSGNTTYLKNIATSTINSLKAVDSNAIWMMQGWLFYAVSAFWTDDRIEAFLSGVQNDSDMLILDLWSESEPQWQRTNSYYGKPWIWCMVHDFGGSMGIYGQINNITQNPVEALANSSSLVGFGLTMESQEGNEIIYDILLEQAWSEAPVDTTTYFHNWVSARYSGSNSVPQGLYQAWEILRTTAYNNTNLTAAMTVTRSVFVDQPALTGLDTVGWGATEPNYNRSELVKVWNYMYDAAVEEPHLWSNPSYQYDMVDFTRQVMANAFYPLYTDLVTLYSQPSSTSAKVSAMGAQMIYLLNSIDAVLSTNTNFQLSQWIESARSWANGSESEAAYFEYNARNQITLWGPTGQVNDYAAKQWAGLVSTYYVPRWNLFIEYLASTPAVEYNQTVFQSKVFDFELRWQTDTWDTKNTQGAQDLQAVVEQVVKSWPHLFGI